MAKLWMACDFWTKRDMLSWMLWMYLPLISMKASYRCFRTSECLVHSCYRCRLVLPLVSVYFGGLSWRSIVTSSPGVRVARSSVVVYCRIRCCRAWRDVRSYLWLNLGLLASARLSSKPTTPFLNEHVT